MATKKIIKSAELKIKARADFAALLFVYSTKNPSLNIGHVHIQSEVN